MLTEIQKSQIQQHAVECYDRNKSECCGFILQDGSILRSKNMAIDPHQEFLCDKQSSAQAERAGIAGYYHSHANNNPSFSLADGILARDVPNQMLVLYTIHGDFKIAYPRRTAPYLDRDFCWYRQDCVALVLDYLYADLGIDIDDRIERPIDLETGTVRSDFDFLPIAKDWGFVRLDPDEPLHIGDVLLFKVGFGLPQHIGVVNDLDRQTFIHQPARAVSSEAPCLGKWMHCCAAVLRHDLLM